MIRAAAVGGRGRAARELTRAATLAVVLVAAGVAAEERVRILLRDTLGGAADVAHELRRLESRPVPEQLRQAVIVRRARILDHHGGGIVPRIPREAPPGEMLLVRAVRGEGDPRRRRGVERHAQ